VCRGESAAAFSECQRRYPFKEGLIYLVFDAKTRRRKETPGLITEKSLHLCGSAAEVNKSEVLNMSVNIQTDPVIAGPDAVLSFWFSERVRPLWFQSTPAFDAELRQRFASTWQAAQSGSLDHWRIRRTVRWRW